MINPWAALVVVLALLCIIVAWKGTQDNVLSAILGRPYGNTGLSTASGAASNSTAAPLPVNPLDPFGAFPPSPNIPT